MTWFRINRVYWDTKLGIGYFGNLVIVSLGHSIFHSIIVYFFLTFSLSLSLCLSSLFLSCPACLYGSLNSMCALVFQFCSCGEPLAGSRKRNGERKTEGQGLCQPGGPRCPSIAPPPVTLGVTPSRRAEQNALTARQRANTEVRCMHTQIHTHSPSLSHSL